MKIHHAFLNCKPFQPVAGFLAVVFLLVTMISDSPAQEGAPVILALGDSLTAGYDVPEEANYPSRLQQRLRKEGYPHRIVNAGVSGDTTAGGLRRIQWLLKHDPEIVILELGANDGLRGLPIIEIYSNLEKIIEICQERQIQVLLTGMKPPPNYGEHYFNEFEMVFFRLAEKYDVAFLPFFLEGVAGDRKYTQADGIHPVVEGYAIVTDTVWKYLQPMLKK